MKFLKLFLVSILILYSCTNNNKCNTGIVQININPADAKDINLSQFVDSIKYIPLRTPDSIVLGEAATIIMREKYIYVLDIRQSIVVLFDLNGSYITTLDKLGNGPEEYGPMSYLYVDNKELNIEIFEVIEGKITRYSLPSFKYLEKIELSQPIHFDTYRKKDDFYYLSTNRIPNIIDNKETNADIIVMKEDKVVKLLFPKIVKRDNSHYPIFGENFIHNNNEELFYSVPFKNTFYKLNKLDATPIINVDFGSYGIDNKLIEKYYPQEQWDYFNSVDFIKKASYPLLTVNNKDITVVSYLFRNNVDDDLYTYQYYINLKNKETVYNTKNIINDLTSFPKKIKISTNPTGIIAINPSYKDNLVTVINPSEEPELEHVDSVFINNFGYVKYDDNPIIIFMKLKK